jgi:hypothetical protein
MIEGTALSADKRFSTGMKLHQGVRILTEAVRPEREGTQPVLLYTEAGRTTVPIPAGFNRNQLSYFRTYDVSLAEEHTVRVTCLYGENTRPYLFAVAYLGIFHVTQAACEVTSGIVIDVETGDHLLDYPPVDQETVLSCIRYIQVEDLTKCGIRDTGLIRWLDDDGCEDMSKDRGKYLRMVPRLTRSMQIAQLRFITMLDTQRARIKELEGIIASKAPVRSVRVKRKCN